MDYIVFGINIRSNRALHGVLPINFGNAAAPDLRLTFAGPGPLPAEWAALPWRVERELQGEGWAMRTWAASGPHGVWHRLVTHLGENETTLLFSPDGAELAVYWQRAEPESDDFWEDISGWVLDSALGFVAHLRGWPVLHGSAVVVDGAAVGLLGHKGAGKSTLAAAFVAAGCPLLTDDHVVVKPEDGVFKVQPGPARLRLWPTSLPVLAKHAEDLPRVYSYLEKRLFEVDQAGKAACGAGVMPLRALYILEPRDPDRAVALLETLAPAAALHQALVFRWNRSIISQEHAAQQLTALAQLTQSIPVRRIHRPNGLETLGQVMRAIREDLA